MMFFLRFSAEINLLCFLTINKRLSQQVIQRVGLNRVIIDFQLLFLNPIFECRFRT